VTLTLSRTICDKARGTRTAIFTRIYIMIEPHRHHHDHDRRRPFAAASASRHRSRRSDAQPSSSRRPLLPLLALLVISSTTNTDAFASRPYTKPSLLACVVNLQGGASGGGSDAATDRATVTPALQAAAAASTSSSSSSASGVADTVREVQTAPIPGMKPGTSGLRKKVEVWQGEHYVENFIQALIDTATARSPHQQVPDTYVFL
jgi:hypothetical protein